MTTIAAGYGLTASEADVAFDIGKNINSGENQFRGYFGEPSTLEADLLRLAGVVFAADRACVRGNPENYGRLLELTIPVVNVGVLFPVKTKIERVLRKLSNDSWTLTFQQVSGEPATLAATRAPVGKTLLFSGGLDSLAATLEMREAKQPFQLVSHVTQSQATRSAQDRLLEALRAAGSIDHYRFLVSSREGEPLTRAHDGEPSQRTRSFVFLILAAIAGVRNGFHDLVVMAENGPLAIHLPLTAARSGAFSTHTAHPQVLKMMSELLTEVFRLEIRISNPFEWMTKGEVVRIVSENLPAAIPLSSSCWAASRRPTAASHCGECVPCIIRRMAIEVNGTDSTSYGRDLLRSDVKALAGDDTGRRNLIDLIEFVTAMKGRTDDEVKVRWPELFSEAVDAPRTIEMYRRFGTEAETVLARYSGVATLLR